MYVTIFRRGEEVEVNRAGSLTLAVQQTVHSLLPRNGALLWVFTEFHPGVPPDLHQLTHTPTHKLVQSKAANNKRSVCIPVCTLHITLYTHPKDGCLVHVTKWVPTPTTLISFS